MDWKLQLTVLACSAALWTTASVASAADAKTPKTPSGNKSVDGGGTLDIDSFAAKVYESPNGGKLLYRLLTPRKPEAGKAYPLVLFLHGAGGRGSDNVGQIRDASFVKLLNKVDFANKYPCYMIAPQVPAGKWWGQSRRRNGSGDANNPLRMAVELVDLFIKQHGSDVAQVPVDPNRVYITGLSMGGYGTWDAIQRRPKFFAAAMPVCGGGDSAEAPKLTKLPIWDWHGDADRAVPVSRSRDMIAAIRKAGGKPIYTEVAGCGHHVWNYAYSSRQAWDWLLAQRLGQPEVPPVGPLPKGTTTGNEQAGK